MDACSSGPAEDLDGNARPASGLWDAGAFESGSEPVQLVAIETSGALVTSEAGAAAEFTVALRKAPLADVIIGMASDDLTEGTLSDTELTFTSENWQTPQPVVITGQDDAVIDGDQSYRVQLGATVSEDSAYNGIQLGELPVENLDNDNAAPGNDLIFEDGFGS